MRKKVNKINFSSQYRSDLIGKLFYYSPKEQNQHTLSGKFIEFVTEEVNCLDRDNQFGHITASAFLVDVEFSSCLLVHHKKLNIWVQPGGHVEPNDKNIIDSCTRELHEETGALSAKLVYSDIFDLDIHEIPEYTDSSGIKIQSHLHFDIRFIFKFDRRIPLQISDESIELKWIKFNEINEVDLNLKIDASVLRMIRKAIKLKN